jgi:hypothetical protein
MSQETPIGNLGGGISDEDSKLVDSILNDINSSSGPPQVQGGNPQQGGGQQPSPEQIKMMQQQQMMRQQALAQQQAQQQTLVQQQVQQQAQQQAMAQKMNMIQGSGSGDVMENVKLEAKNIMTVVFLCILFNIEQVDNILKGVSMFVNEGGGLNMQAVFLKSIVIGLIFYIVKTYLL